MLNSFEKVAEHFRLPYSHRSQDWEIEVADPTRIPEFIDGFSSLVDPSTRRVLAELIIASFDEAVDASQFDLSEWQRFWSIIREDFEDYSFSIEYWCNRPGGGSWSITSHLRASLSQDGLSYFLRELQAGADERALFRELNDLHWPVQ